MNPNDAFARAQSALAQGQYGQCLEMLSDLNAAIGEHAAISQMRAMALAHAGDRAAARVEFARAVQLSGDRPDPALLANYARLLWEDGDFADARSLLQRAAALAPRDAAIIALHITAIRRQEGDEAADRAWRAQIDAEQGSAAMCHYYALFLRDAGRLGAAIDAIERAIALNPASANAKQLRARISAGMGRPSARQFADLAGANSLDDGGVTAWAAAQFHEGDAAGALATLDKWIAQHPGAIQAIETRLSMTSQTQSASAARAWIDELTAARPGDAAVRGLRLHFIWQSLGAQAALAEADAMRPDAALAERVQCAELLSEADEQRQAQSMFDAMADELCRAPAALQMAEVRHLLRCQAIEEATRQAHEIAMRTRLVEAWAYTELGWRLMGDDRWDWLLRGGAAVQTYDLTHFEEYREDLETGLRRMHCQMRDQPFEQSVRGGTQTDGFLLGREDDAIQGLRADLDDAVARYCAMLDPIATDHPLARIAGAQTRITGSWSVLLRSAGNHAVHFHNEGALSSACYIALPGGIGGGEGGDVGKAGWLEFGRSPAHAGVNVEPFADVRPVEGRLVLFPSFLFHGTRPFADGERLTVAFDVAEVSL